MFVSCWSVKGGAGTTVFAASLALSLSASSPGAVLVDLAGDVPAVLGLAEPAGAGLAAWLAAGAAVPADALARLEVPATEGLGVVPLGAHEERRSSASSPLAERAEVLAGLLAAEPRHVVVDCGLIRAGGGDAEHVATVLAACATHSWLVTRSCYLSLRRAARSPLQPSAFVLVRESGRAMHAADIESVLGVPLAAEVAVEPSVARAVDSGLLASRAIKVILHVDQEAA